MKTLSIPTFTAICLLIMTICTSVAVAQTQISTIEDLNNIRNNLNSNYVLMNDLDFNDDASYANATANKANYTPNTDDPATATNAGWAPIGNNNTNSTRFIGGLEGNGFTISNLYINRNGTEVGLFGATGKLAGRVGKGVVQNLGLLDAYVKGENTVGTFAGVNFSTIQNCYATGTVAGTSYLGGLVGVNKSYSIGIITNCYAAVTVSGTGDNVGGLIGEINTSSISNCYATGAVSGTGDNVGGLIGVSRGVFIVTISNCFWDKDTTGRTNSAGSPNDKGLSTTALKALTATSTNWNTNNWDFGDNTQYPTLRTLEASGGAQALGFVLCNQPANYVSCITTPVLQSSLLDFGPTTRPTTTQLVIIGRNLSGTITLSAIEAPFSYAEGQVLTFMPNDQGRLKVAIPITLTNTGLGEAHTTSITVTGGSLSQDVIIPIAGFSTDILVDTDDNNLLEINSIEDLNKVRNNLGADYELTRNLDFADPNSYASMEVNNAYRPLDNADPAADGAAVVDPADGQNPGFVPIGKSFTGTFDGQNFTISNAYINKPGYTGLFAAVAGGSTVKNLGLVDVYVRGTSRVGRLTGENKGLITNCYSTGTVSATETNRDREMWVGGLVGENYGKIENCYADGTVNGAGAGLSNVGGLVGENFQIITNCYALGAVTGMASRSKSARTGGLVGNISVAGTRNPGSISNSYAAVTTTGTAPNGASAIVGGLVGWNRGGSITNCYATGAVSGTRKDSGGSSVLIGGLVGWHFGENATMTNCYATGRITATSGGRVRAGGLVGQNESDPGDPLGVAVNSFWDRETTGRGSSVGSPNSAGLSTATLQALIAIGTATNEDDRWSANNWVFAPTCQYPTLRSYKTNDATPPVQIQGDLLAGQTAPKLQTACDPSIGLTPDANAFINGNNSYGIGNVIIGGSGLLTYTITGASLTEDVSLTLAGEGAGAFAITSPTNTTLSPTDGALSQVVTITFNPTAEERYVATITHTGGGLTNSLVLTIAGRGTVTAPITTPNAGVLGLEVGLENIESTNTTAIRLSPNPITDRLNIQGNGTLQVQVRNILGTTLLVTEIIETGDLDCSALPPGLYLVSVQSTTRTQTQRILKR